MKELPFYYEICYTIPITITEVLTSLDPFESLSDLLWSVRHFKDVADMEVRASLFIFLKLSTNDVASIA